MPMKTFDPSGVLSWMATPKDKTLEKGYLQVSSNVSKEESINFENDKLSSLLTIHLSANVSLRIGYGTDRKEPGSLEMVLVAVFYDDIGISEEKVYFRTRAENSQSVGGGQISVDWEILDDNSASLVAVRFATDIRLPVYRLDDPERVRVAKHQMVIEAGSYINVRK